MKKLFIVGSGFSKSISSHMPTIIELSKYIQKCLSTITGDTTLYQRYSSDPERLLSYLYQPLPWKLEEELYIDKAAFISLSKMMTEHIKDCERKAFTEQISEWAYQFVEYLHKNEITVATLNYDTIIERLSRKLKPSENNKGALETSNFYRMPLAPIGGRTNSLWGTEWYKTYHLLKLHGSINWYYFGEENIIGQQVYYIPVRKESPIEDIYDDFTESSLVDLVPLIIPPVADKSVFYRTRLVKILWSDFRVALQEADEIYCIGYSLPKTDLTTSMFLNGFTDSTKKIYIVNNAKDQCAEELVKRYHETLTECKIDDTYLGSENSVELMVNNLL
jgi:hypothetical protein